MAGVGRLAWRAFVGKDCAAFDRHPAKPVETARRCAGNLRAPALKTAQIRLIPVKARTFSMSDLIVEI